MEGIEIQEVNLDTSQSSEIDTYGGGLCGFGCSAGFFCGLGCS